VILSWVAPNNPNPMLKIIDEISTKLLEPIRKFIPSAGGLDFSPIFALILIRQIEILLASIIRTLV
jgi:YggT family protein